MFEIEGKDMSIQTGDAAGCIPFSFIKTKGIKGFFQKVWNAIGNESEQGGT
ncbi:hypothetical protein J21TS7_55360 [Paenibacillus cineris]|uniref:Uncharacterized protein n=1 Tax=Paenibacillus cineris TaxID=237530 RepID=A0ABQ4LL16_9BACL|nr:hypothetical protein J21TS7_55360 [Paenibacillus cineris]